MPHVTTEHPSVKNMVPHTPEYQTVALTFSVHISVSLPLSHPQRDTHGPNPGKLWEMLGVSVTLTSDGTLGGAVVRNPAANVGDPGDAGLSPGSGRSPSPSRKRQPTPFLRRKSPGRGSLVGYRPWGCKVRHN